MAAAHPEDPINFPFIIVGNKIDLNPQERVITSSKAENWCNTCSVNPLKYIETSAKENVNINEAFEYLANEAIKRPPPASRYEMKQTVKLNYAVGEEKKKCCK